MNIYLRYEGDGRFIVDKNTQVKIDMKYQPGAMCHAEINSIRSVQQLKFLWAVVGTAFDNWNESIAKPPTKEELMNTLKYECGLTEEKRRINLKTGETIIEIVPLSIKLASLESARMNQFTNNVISVLAAILQVDEAELTSQAQKNIMD